MPPCTGLRGVTGTPKHRDEVIIGERLPGNGRHDDFFLRFEEENKKGEKFFLPIFFFFREVSKIGELCSFGGSVRQDVANICSSAV